MTFGKVFVPCYSYGSGSPSLRESLLKEFWKAKLSILLFDEVILDFRFAQGLKDTEPGADLLNPKKKIENRSTKNAEIFTTKIPNVHIAKFDDELPKNQYLTADEEHRIRRKWSFNIGEHFVYTAHIERRHIYRRTLVEMLSSELNTPIHEQMPAPVLKPSSESLGIAYDIRPLVLDRILTIPSPDIKTIKIKRLARERGSDAWEQLRKLVSQIARKVSELDNPTANELVGAVDRALLEQVYAELRSRMTSVTEISLGMVKGAISFIPGLSGVLSLMDMAENANKFVKDRSNWVSFISRL